jgi:hypothetical protein
MTRAASQIRLPLVVPLVCAVAALVCAPGVSGQTAGAVPAAQVSAQPSPSPWDYRGLEMTRGSLEELLAQYDAVVSSSVYSERLREGAQSSATRIRDRLEQGDFRPGDRIVVEIDGEAQVADTVIVDSDRRIALTGMEPIALAGVLRSELQDHLEREIGRFIKAPTVRTASLIRLIMQGAIGSPGFYMFPATALLEDVIMQAGGPAGDADLDNVEIERNGTVLMKGAEVRTALTEGLSVDQLNLRAGDQIMIPAVEEETGSIWMGLMRYAIMIGAPLLLGIRIF